MDNKIYKTVICRHYNSARGCDKGDNCGFAHGEKDLRKKKCDSYDKCWDEDCYLNFSHPPKWNAYDNKEECLICEKGYCNKLNKRFKHIIDNYNFDIKDDKNNKMDIPKDRDFPDLIKTNKQNNNESNKDNKYKYSEILTSNLKNKLNIKDNKIMDEEYDSEKDILENIPNITLTINISDEKSSINSNDNNLEHNMSNYEKLKETENNIVKQLKDNYILLKNLDPNDWSDDVEIDNIRSNIKILEEKYNKIKDIKKIDIFEDNLNLDIIFNENNNNEFYPIPSIISNNININNDIKNLVNILETDFKSYNEKIKENINNILKNDDLKFILMNNLNEINFKIIKFKNNYEDINKYKI